MGQFMEAHTFEESKEDFVTTQITSMANTKEARLRVVATSVGAGAPGDSQKPPCDVRVKCVWACVWH